MVPSCDHPDLVKPGPAGPWRLCVCANCGTTYHPNLDTFESKHQWQMIDVVPAPRANDDRPHGQERGR